MSDAAAQFDLTPHWRRRIGSRLWQIFWSVGCSFTLMGAANAQLIVQRIYTGPPNLTTVPPLSSLVQASDGNFYGTIPSNGQLPYGTVFRLTPRGVYTTLVSFIGANGKDPEGPLVLANDGNMYGTTMTGGLSGFRHPFPDHHGGRLPDPASFHRLGHRVPAMRPDSGQRWLLIWCDDAWHN